MNEATSVNDHEQRRAARKRYQAHYRALYDQLLEILFELDPIGVHQNDADKFVPELATMLPRLREARIADDVEQIVLEELRRWYGRRRLANLDPDRLADATIAICSAWNHFSSRQLDSNAPMTCHASGLLLANRQAEARS